MPGRRRALLSMQDVRGAIGEGREPGWFAVCTEGVLNKAFAVIDLIIIAPCDILSAVF